MTIIQMAIRLSALFVGCLAAVCILMPVAFLLQGWQEKRNRRRRAALRARLPDIEVEAEVVGPDE